MNDRDLRFVDEYMIDYDAKNAAIRAGYSEKTARNASAWINPKNPKKPTVRALIDGRMAMLSARCGISQERVLRELAIIAFSNIDDIVDPETGALLEDGSRVDRAAVASMRVKGSDEREVRMYDKLRALELLGKRLKLFDEAGGGAEGEKPRILILPDGGIEVEEDA